MNAAAIADAAAQVERLAADLDVDVEWSDTASAVAWRRKRRIRCGPIRGQVSYLTALHELGHIAIRPEPPLRLSQEAAAWRWALAQSREDPTRATWRRILAYLDAYAARVERRPGMIRPPDFDAFHAEIARAAG